MDGEGYFTNSNWLCMIGPYRYNQRFMLIKWVCAGLIIISINGHSKWIQKKIRTWKHSHQPATPSSTLNLMRPTLRICGAQPDMVQRRPRGRFRILDEEATRWESDPGMRTWDEFGFEGEFVGGDGVGGCESHSGTVREMTYAKEHITISGGCGMLPWLEEKCASMEHRGFLL